MINRKNILALSVVLGVLLSTNNISAARPDFSLPEKAVEVSNGVFSLGKAYDAQTKMEVDGFAIVHKKGNAKSAAAAAGKGGKAQCYSVMAAGAKWKTVEPWETFGGPGLDSNFILTNTALNIGKWEAAAGADILGEGTQGAGIIGDPYELDDQNQVSFEDLEGGTIAVTIVWGNWGGPTTARQIVAWDQIYNTDFEWSATGDAGKMDFENISTHELGHSMGLADIYTNSCASVTMYGYGTEGETKKRTLENADIAGINTLY